MIPAVLLRGVQAITPGKPVGEGRGDAQRLLPQLDPGEILSARIEGRLPDGNFKVLVAGKSLSMALPSYLTPGDTLELAFVGREPRLSFALVEAPQTAPLPVLSAAGRLVASLMPSLGEPVTAAAAANATPLLAALPGDGAALSSALQDTLTHSGLFYEAHQAEWVSGKRELAQLRLESQARFAPDAPQGVGLPAPASAAGASNGTMPSAAKPAEQMIHPDGMTLVQQQLAALETGKVLVRLEVWPGQWMEWEIAEHPQDGPQEQAAPPDWQTRLRVDLPQLGELAAALKVGSAGLRIELSAASPRSAELLQDNRLALEASLAAAGLPPASIAISRHEAS